jgi:hypothetical protein
MKRTTLPRVNISPHEILSTKSLSHLKGGANATTMDDKRRERPGGGIST